MDHGGASILALDVARGMAQRGHQVTFVCSGEDDRRYTRDGFFVRVLELNRRNPLFHYLNLPLMAGLNRLLREIRPDIIHVHNINLKTFSLGTLFFSRHYPMVWTLHDLWAICMAGWPDPPDCEKMTNGCPGCASWPGALVRINRTIKRAVYGMAPFTVVTPSKWLADLFSGSSFSGRPVRVVRNGLDPARFSPGKKRHTLERGDSREKRLLFCGGRRVDGRSPAQRKGWEDLVGALCILRKKHHALHVLYTGDPLDLPSQFPVPVTFTGPVTREEMGDFYRSADLFVLPTLADNSPLTILEAMALKVPVIATEVGGIPEIIRHGQTGLLSRPRDAECLALRIDELLSDPSRAALMAAQAYKKVTTEFSFNQMLNGYESLYLQTISASGRQLMISS